MPDQQPMVGDSVLTDVQITNLSMHFFDGLRGHLRIVGSSGVFLCTPAFPEFKIRHVNIDQAIEQ